jgi:Protein of unknown function (DUF2950)
MFNSVGDRTNWSLGHLLLAASVALIVPSTACNKQDAASTVQAGPTTFSSPQEAGKALAAAATSQDQNELKRIFGSSSAGIISTGDPLEDKASFSGFAQAYQSMNRWRRLSDGNELLLVGGDNQAFPIPLVKNAAGQWYFDAAAGKDEILARRIGHNEITAIGVCAAVVDAQDQYSSQKHAGVKQYAQKFISNPGQQDGLYWDSPQGSTRSPLGPLIAYATAEGYKVQPNQHRPFNGYYFAMLDKQGSNAKGGAKSYVVDGKMTGGFAVLAYPAQYGESGIMTFIVNQNGVMFQKDLGKGTDEIASAMTDFNPDKTWNAVQ